MNVRIQTYGLCLCRSGMITRTTKQNLTCGIENTTAFEALEKGFDDLMDLCDVVAEKFADAREEFMNEQAM